MTIGEFAKKAGVSTSTLRYYEAKGLIRIERDGAGRRIFDERDIEWVKFLMRLKNTGMQLKDIQHYSDLRYIGDSTMPERLEMLLKHQLYVDEQKRMWEEYSDNLKSKIEFYRNAIDNIG